MTLYTQTPEPPNQQCKLLKLLLSMLLSYGAFIIGISVWWFYNWYYAFSAFLLSFILIGILRSKLLHSSIPKVQQEFTYADKDIIGWYLHMSICPSKVE